MDLALAKANRLKKKFRFNARDWRSETDDVGVEMWTGGLESTDHPQPQVVWERPLLAVPQQVSLGAEVWIDP